MILVLQTTRSGETLLRKVSPRLLKRVLSTTTTTTRTAGQAFRRLQQMRSGGDGATSTSTYSKNKKQPLHSSATVKQSTTTCDFTHSSPARSQPQQQPQTAGELLNSLNNKATASSSSVDRPPIKALRTLFIASAIPMVGFGFMDNLVMIQAGQYIDSTLGVSLGLATMTAAAAGQIVSDVSGVIFGGSLERLLTRLSLIKSPNISTQQRQLPICRNVAMAGAVVGVVIGCALGALSLLLVDLEARHRIERATQLREIVTDMITDIDDDADDGVVRLASDTCTIYIASSRDFQLDENGDGSAGDGDDNWRTSMKLLQDADDESSSLVHDCAIKQDVIVSPNNGGSLLYVPIMDGDDLLAVIEFKHNGNKSNEDDSGDVATGFSEHDVQTAKVMARHIAIFMNRIVG